LPHTYTHLITHIIFSTKGRERLIAPDVKAELYLYIGGVIREEGGTLLAINGMEDHLHLLVTLPGSIPVSQLMRVVKANSSRWVKQKWPQHNKFAWQEGYGAFSVSESAKEDVQEYIRNQEEHHKKRSFQEEFIALLKKHNITYDERYL
jgi:putative transposase